MSNHFSYKDVKNENEKIYPVNKVVKGYWYYERFLTEKCIGMFKYTGLPDSLPSTELEYRLIKRGMSPIFKAKHGEFKGSLVTCDSSISGVDSYYHGIYCTYAQPALQSGTLTIGKDCAMVYNSYLDMDAPSGLSELIARYATLLADIDASIDIATINRRATALGSAQNAQAAKSVDNVLEALRNGEIKTIVEDSILDSFKTLPFDNNSRLTLDELITVKQALKREFFAEVGIKSSTDKKERLITDEVATENQLLMVNIDDMLNARKIGIAKCNEIFGTNITVEIDEDYNPRELYTDTESGVEQNDTERISDNV